MQVCRSQSAGYINKWPDILRQGRCVHQYPGFAIRLQSEVASETRVTGNACETGLYVDALFPQPGVGLAKAMVILCCFYTG